MRCLPSIHGGLCGACHRFMFMANRAYVVVTHTRVSLHYIYACRRDASAAAALSPSSYHAHDSIPPSPPQKTFRLTPSPPPSPPPPSPRPYPYTCGHMHRGRHNQRIGSPYALHTRLGPIIMSLTTAAPTGWAHSHLTFYPTGFGVTCAVLAIDSSPWPTGSKWLWLIHVYLATISMHMSM